MKTDQIEFKKNEMKFFVYLSGNGTQIKIEISHSDATRIIELSGYVLQDNGTESKSTYWF